MLRRSAFVLAVAALCAAVPVRAQDSKSASLAKELAQLLDQKKLENVAAADSQNLGTYTAALYFPGSQLLLVSAKYSAPALLNEKIGKKDYRDVYIDLNSASVAGSKLFVIDLNGDGLIARPADNQGPDSAELAGKSFSFDGEWKKAKISETDYMKAYADADAAYAHALQLLITQLKSGT